MQKYVKYSVGARVDVNNIWQEMVAVSGFSDIFAY